jgi:hypothetical protein
MRSAVLATLLACTLLLAACGGEDEGPDPATLAPPDAPLYVEALVRPEGEQREDALEALGKVLLTDAPEQRLRELLQDGGEDGFDYERDVDPWLGERVGVWARDLQAEEPAFTLIAAATDTDQALEAVEAAARREGTELEERSHEGTDYLFDAQEATGAAAVEDFLVVGTEPELQRTIEVSGDDSLAESERYEQLIDDLPDDRIGTLFVDQRAAFEATQAPEGGPEAQILNSLFNPRELQPGAAALVADGERIVIDSVTRRGGSALVNQLAGLTSEPTELLGELPADAWVAFGLNDLGSTVDEVFTQVAGALGGAAIEGQFREQTGLDLRRDVLGWMGDVGVYASGAGPEALRGALVIEITDAERAESAFGRLDELLRAMADAQVGDADVDGADQALEVRSPDLPDPVVLAHNAERMVIGYGAAAAEAVLGDADQLADTELWERGRTILGDLEPSFLLDMAQVIANVEAFGGADAEFERARPYLEAYDVVASGGQVDGEDQSGRLAAGLR